MNRKRTGAEELPQDVGELPRDVRELPQDVGELPQDAEELPPDAGELPPGAKALVLEARVENLERLFAFMDRELEPLDCPPKVQAQLYIAVEELFVNIAHYAYAPKTGSAAVRMETRREPKRVTITFFDRGVPYNPLLKPDPDVTLSAEERQIGGLGIFMVKKSMDEMRYAYRDGQNVLTIVKNLDGN